jgi:myo-inositol-1(or 4)-monophosphatase
MLQVALEAARAAASVHAAHLGQVAGDQWAQKGVADFVTHVDREAEARILEIVRANFPDHAIMAEESADDEDANAGHEWLWVIDPLDGTTNFLHGYPMYCASVAALRNGVPTIGAVVTSSTNEEWAAVEGGGAFRNGQRIHVSETARFDRALIGTGFPFKMPDVLPHYLNQFHTIIRQVSDIRRAGSAALDLCHVASGYLDGFWELDLRPWDYAAGVLMIREAGGVVNGLFDQGSRVAEPAWQGAGGIIAGNNYVYQKLCDVVLDRSR